MNSLPPVVVWSCLRSPCVLSSHPPPPTARPSTSFTKTFPMCPVRFSYDRKSSVGTNALCRSKGHLWACLWTGSHRSGALPSLVPDNFSIFKPDGTFPPGGLDVILHIWLKIHHIFCLLVSRLLHVLDVLHYSRLSTVLVLSSLVPLVFVRWRFSAAALLEELQGVGLFLFRTAKATK